MSRKRQFVVGSLAVAAIVGFVVAPSAYAVTGSSTVSANIGAIVSIDSTTGTVNLGITPVAGGAQTTASDTVTVTTNKSNGYNLAISTPVASLTSGGNTIPSTAGTWTAPLALLNNTWGYAVASGTTGLTASNGFDASYAAISSQTTSTAKYSAVPTSTYVFRTTGAAATADTTTVWYSAKADTTKPNGSYTAAITYTALTN